MAQTVKNPPAMWEIWVWSLGWEYHLEQGMATDSGILTWKIPMDRTAWWATVHGVSRVRYNWATEDSTAYIHTYIYVYAAAAAKLPQSHPILCNPTDGSPPGSAIPGILQARILEWVAISISNAWKWKVIVKSPSRVQLSNPMDCSPSGSSVFMYMYICINV